MKSFIVPIAVLLAAQIVRAQSWPDISTEVAPQGGGGQDAALVVGISDYVYLPAIPGAAENAAAWQQWLVRTRKVPGERVVILRDKEATREKILKNLSSLKSQVGPQGTVWFIFIGHGAPSPSGDDGLLLGADTDADADSLLARGLPQESIFQALDGTRGTPLVVFDACFSGKTADGTASLVKGLQATLPVRRVTAAREHATILSSSETFAGPLPRGDRPAFSYLILGALRGWGDSDGDREVTLDEAFAFARGTMQAGFQTDSRLPTKRGPSRVLAVNVQGGRPEVDAILLGRCPSGTAWEGFRCTDAGAVKVAVPLRKSFPPLTPLPKGERAGETRKEPRTGLTWVWIPPGEFLFGCEPHDSQCAPVEALLEKPTKKSVDGFWMLQTEVPVAAYATCKAAGACSGASLDVPEKTCNLANGRSQHPMNCVDHSSAAQFCAWVGGRLPTSREWQYAAKGGASRIYPWGDTPITGKRGNFCDQNCAHALNANNLEEWREKKWISESENDGFAATAPVGSYPAGSSIWGLLDMAGNVAEWTLTAYDTSAMQTRGGSWGSAPAHVRASHIGKDDPRSQDDGIGFRCARGVGGPTP